MSQHQRNFGLDVIRTVAIVLVLIAHSMYVLYPYMSGFAEIMFNFGTWMTGAYGVELFFVLSGFLIGGIFIRDEIYRRDKADAERKSDLRSVSGFYLRRLIRTIPNYILYFFIFLTADRYFQKGNFLHSFPWKNFFLVQNFYHNDGRGFMGIAWSLSVEEFFYLFLPLLYILFRLLKRTRMNAFLYTACILWLVPNLLKLHYLFFLAPHTGFINIHLLHTTLFRLDSIAYGIFLAVIYQCDFAKSMQRWVQERRIHLLLAGILLTVAGLAYNFLFVIKPVQQANMIYWSYPLRSIGLVLLFPFFIGWNKARAGLMTKAISYTALFSYSIYLSHVIVIESFEELKVMRHWNIAPVLQMLIVWVLTFLISAGTYYGLEKPVLKLRDKLIIK
ncbi:MAG: acyltransferase [Chitinophagaceae bacterium]